MNGYEQTYLPAARAFRARSANQAALAREIEQWSTEVAEDWHGLRFGATQVTLCEDNWRFEVEVWLGDLLHHLVQVQLYAESCNGDPGTPVPMEMLAPIPGAVNGFLYGAVVSAERPAEHYTPRVTAYHKGASIPQEDRHILWGQCPVQLAVC